MFTLDKFAFGKKAKLTRYDINAVRSHVIQGIEYLIKNGVSRNSYILRYISEHHERCDGSGYPAGSYGNDLSLGGKILAVVDVYVTLSSTKVFKQTWSKENAIMYLNKHKEDIFNIDIVDTLIKILEKE